MYQKCVLIFAGGDKDLSKDEFQKMLSEFQITPESIFSIIAADSGGDFARTCDITPTLLIGDLDSLSQETLSLLASIPEVVVEKYPQDKNETDLELALNRAISFNPESIFIFGAFGGRLDHELANISLCSDNAYEKAKITLVGKNQCGYIVHHHFPLTLSGNKGEIFSLIPLTDEVLGVCIAGSRWELNNATLKAGRSRSVCNEFADSPVKISINKGKILVLTRFGASPQDF